VIERERSGGAAAVAAACALVAGILAAPRAAAAGPQRLVVFEGACDASGAVTLGGSRILVADDEDNVLRVYDARRGGAPLASADVSAGLALPAGKRAPEADIEAATRVGSLALWLTSHGNRKSGKRDPSRFRFFATTRPRDGAPALVGRPYDSLAEDLLAAPQLAALGLEEALRRAPDAGGVNIEGMTAAPDGASVVLGFRSPTPGGRALVVPLLNPTEVIRGARGRFGAPVLLDLGGLGIRAISWWRGRYLLVAGGLAGEARSRLFTWSGREEDPPAAAAIDLEGLNPEAFASDPGADEVLLLSDDGAVPVDGTECKRLKDPARKRFRGVWVRP
jgi:hypothetical protein